MKAGQMVLILGLAAGCVAGDVRYRVVLLERPEDRYGSLAYAINEAGMVLGLVYRQRSSAQDWAVFVHTPERGLEVIPDYAGQLIWPSRLNSRGQFTAELLLEGTSLALRYTPGVGFECLGDLGGRWTSPSGINSRGDVVGHGYLASEDGLRGIRSFFYSDETGIVELGTFGGIASWAVDINDQGYIVGSAVFESEDDEGRRRYVMGYLFHPDQGLTWLGLDEPGDINEHMSVLCWGDEWGPVLLRDGRRISILAANWTWPVAPSGLNDANVVVGEGHDYRESWSAPRGTGWIWTERDGIRNVNDFICQDPGWHIDWIAGINNHGQMAAVATLAGEHRAVRLDPIAPKLRVGASNGQVIVSWWPAWPGVVLEATDSLASPDWRPLPGVETNVVSLPLTNSARFFRLNLDALRGLCCAPDPPLEPQAPVAYATVKRDSVAVDLARVFQAFAGLQPFPVLSGDGVRATAAFEGGGFDANDDPLSFEWSVLVEGHWEVFAQTRLATNVFYRAGIHQAQLRVCDGALSGTNRLELQVFMPADFVRAFIAAIEASPDRSAGADAFVQVLGEAAALFELGDYPAALSALEAALALPDAADVLTNEWNDLLPWMIDTFRRIVEANL